LLALSISEFLFQLDSEKSFVLSYNLTGLISHALIFSAMLKDLLVNNVQPILE
jgi:hypothetical protein